MRMELLNSDYYPDKTDRTLRIHPLLHRLGFCRAVTLDLALEVLDHLPGILLRLLGIIRVGNGRLGLRQLYCTNERRRQAHLVSSENLTVMGFLTIDFAPLVHLVEAAFGIRFGLVRVVVVVHSGLCENVSRAAQVQQRDLLKPRATLDSGM